MKNIVICLLSLTLLACSENNSKLRHLEKKTTFGSDGFIVKKNTSKQVKGQVVYLPVYSSIPYLKQGKNFNVSAFVAIHNTDLNSSMKVLNVLLFDINGNLILNYISNDCILKPLRSVKYFVPEITKRNTASYVVVEWVSDRLINEPLVESVMISLTGGQGVSLLSVGRIIREED